MFLAEAENLDVAHGDPLEAAIEAWQHTPGSVISDHRERCCRVAQEWLLAMDYSHAGASPALTGPRWIRQRYRWGPTRWPVHWCEVVERETLDCGALAALARTAFLARGLRCHTAQLVEQFTREGSLHWCRNWAHGQADTQWIRDDLVYHEACAVVLPSGPIRIWDPTTSWWIDPQQREGYGAVLAVRIVTAQAQAPVVFEWGQHRIRGNTWQRLQKARERFS